MNLRELLHNIIDVNFDVEIKGVTCNPKRVKEGYLFICVSEEGEKCMSDLKALAIIANFATRDARIHIFHPNPH